MKQSALKSFKSNISEKLKKCSIQPSPNRNKLEFKIKAAQEFYKEYQDELCVLIEDTQTTYPVTNTIFLLHLIEKEVNTYYGIMREYPGEEYAEMSYRKN